MYLVSLWSIGFALLCMFKYTVLGSTINSLRLIELQNFTVECLHGNVQWMVTFGNSRSRAALCQRNSTYVGCTNELGSSVIVSYKKPEEYNSSHMASPKTSYFHAIRVDPYLKRIECQDYNNNSLVTWIVEVTSLDVSVNGLTTTDVLICENQDVTVTCQSKGSSDSVLTVMYENSEGLVKLFDRTVGSSLSYTLTRDTHNLYREPQAYVQKLGCTLQGGLNVTKLIQLQVMNCFTIEPQLPRRSTVNLRQFSTIGLPVSIVCFVIIVIVILVVYYRRSKHAASGRGQIRGAQQHQSESPSSDIQPSGSPAMQISAITNRPESILVKDSPLPPNFSAPPPSYEEVVYLGR
ncbi:uncharacterized protein LOC106070419 isoform X1 [Biomphalaria glabrata]|uniref:Uncharacterized protein LOC106070419 isoform X1 n=2 Tax=Biomphalaria glabrata TaxID=6526 RepID=A0A9W2YMQ2_BIOGL|nr:uncharacterized protein LOC106070419 isoform X1 [Biomphalaria glabrata]